MEPVSSRVLLPNQRRPGVNMEMFKHTQTIESLIEQGKLEEATELHNQHVKQYSLGREPENASFSPT
jgi:hypothetical protein